MCRIRGRSIGSSVRGQIGDDFSVLSAREYVANGVVERIED